MEKPANSTYTLHPLIQRRYSPRAFSSKPVAHETLLKLFEAARWAPSSNNLQPWRFYIGTRGQGHYFDTIFESLVEFNQNWCVSVPILAVIAAYTVNEKSGGINHSAAYDCGQAAAFITLQAMSEDLWVHQMGGFDKKWLSEKMKLPGDTEPLTVLAIGYKGELSDLNERFHKSETASRERKSLESMIFFG